MTEYKDFNSDEMETLEEEVEAVLKRKGEAYTHDLAKEQLSHEAHGWTFDTFRMALTALRKKWQDEGKIRVETEGENPVKEKKKWIPTDELLD